MADNTSLNTMTGGDVIATDDIAGVKHQQIKVEFGGDGTATPVSSTVGMPTNEIQIGGTSVNAFPAGFARVTDEPRQVFYDPFDSIELDTGNRWSTPVMSGGGVEAVLAGSLTLGSGTTANGYSYLSSQPRFTPTIPAWLSNSWAIQIEAGAAGDNAVRFWGMGLVGGTPSTTSPLGPTGNGYGFELDTSGVLQAVVYSNGTRTAVASLASLQPTDGAYHRYIVFYRTDRIFWYVDTLASTGLGATSNFQSPQLQTLPLLALAVAHSSGPAASRVITCTGLAVSDTGKNATSLSDGINQWRKQTVKAPATAAAAADMAAVVALHPSSPGPFSIRDGQLAVQSDTQLDLLREILIELKTLTYYLNTGMNVRQDPKAVRREVARDQF